MCSECLQVDWCQEGGLHLQSRNLKNERADAGVHLRGRRVFDKSPSEQQANISREIHLNLDECSPTPV